MYRIRHYIQIRHLARVSRVFWVNIYLASPALPPSYHTSIYKSLCFKKWNMSATCRALLALDLQSKTLCQHFMDQPLPFPNSKPQSKEGHVLRLQPKNKSDPHRTYGESSLLGFLNQKRACMVPMCCFSKGSPTPCHGWVLVLLLQKGVQHWT